MQKKGGKEHINYGERRDRKEGESEIRGGMGWKGVADDGWRPHRWSELLKTVLLVCA